MICVNVNDEGHQCSYNKFLNPIPFCQTKESGNFKRGLLMDRMEEQLALLLAKGATISETNHLYQPTCHNPKYC